MSRIVVILALGLLLQGRHAQAQSAGSLPTFEAISVKESPGGFPLRSLLIFAYDVPFYQLAALPEWVSTIRYEINALASRVPTLAEQQPMLRVLLAERFGLVARTDTQERPIYALVLARSDRQLGPALQPTSTDCTEVYAKRAPLPSGFSCEMAMGPGLYRRPGIPLSLLVETLSTRLERPVVDRTGLTGLFNVDLRYRPLTDAPNTSGADEPDLMTALADQLGLKVESTRASVPVIVFDRIERPRPD
jgi:uncharacterized protein (TIGR03435 family)